jgi:hypothetical protein
MRPTELAESQLAVVTGGSLTDVANFFQALAKCNGVIGAVDNVLSNLSQMAKTFASTVKVNG